MFKFGKLTATDLAERKLEEAKVHYIEAQLCADHWAAMAAMYRARVQFLHEHIDELDDLEYGRIDGESGALVNLPPGTKFEGCAFVPETTFSSTPPHTTPVTDFMKKIGALEGVSASIDPSTPLMNQAKP